MTLTPDGRVPVTRPEALILNTLVHQPVKDTGEVGDCMKFLLLWRAVLGIPGAAAAAWWFEGALEAAGVERYEVGWYVDYVDPWLRERWL
jgi:hypothetical protein